MIDSTAIGPFAVRQSVMGNHESLPAAYDLIFAVLSWESRCLSALPYLKGRGKRVTVIHFASADMKLEEAKKSNLQLMKLELGDDFGEVLTIGSSVNHQSNFPKLYSFIEDVAVRKKRPLHILFDMTCLAKRYLLYLLGVCFGGELAVALDYLYSEGKYISEPDIPGIEGFRNVVSLGNWEMLQVPYFEGKEFTLDREHDLFISVGLELHSLLEYIDGNEPKNLVLFDVTGGEYRVQGSLLTATRTRLATLCQLPNAKLKEFDLHDVIGLARELISVNERKTTCMAIGSKPHALAMGLAALANKRIEVTCRVPAGYHGNEISALGPVHRFEIKDRFNPASYRFPKDNKD